MALEIVFQKLIERTGERPEITIVAYTNVVGLRDVRELVDEFAVLIEDLNAVIGPVGDVHAAVAIYGNRMRCIELAIPRARGSPSQQKLSILIELYDARVAISVADKKCAVRQPGDVGRPLEMFVVVAGLVSQAKS